ncbi:MAG: hypothetical protein H0X24_04625 [Ktedonobacterales bacterium]|nr:hypothetical protein [Ktedonobacterales bacterium]
MKTRLRSGNGRPWRMLVAFGLALLLALLTVVRARSAEGATLPPLVYAQRPCVSLRATPSATGKLIATTIPGAGLRVTGLSSDGQWYHALFLGTLPIWVLASDVATRYQTGLAEVEGCPFADIPPYTAHPITGTVGPFPLQVTGTVTQYGELHASAAPTARVTAEITPGQRAYISQWAADTHGGIWYLAHVGENLGWLWAYTVILDGPDPATATLANGQPVWSVAAGKGFWTTNYLPRHTDIPSLITAMKALGITHIYPRVAETSFGFFDQNTLDRLIPAAHAAGIKVIAWVYPYLRNVADDLRMSQAVANYHTPTGDHVDGIGADVEETTDAPAVFAYGQVLRQMVGPQFPLVITTYSPHARASYPFPEAAASFNVIAPQDYWHYTATGTFDGQSARALLTVSVLGIRAELGGKAFPIEENGQMYDMFTYGEPGGSEPSAAEITGDLQTAKDLGLVGASFFDLRTASPDELGALQQFAW